MAPREPTSIPACGGGRGTVPFPQKEKARPEGGIPCKASSFLGVWQPSCLCMAGASAGKGRFFAVATDPALCSGRHFLRDPSGMGGQGQRPRVCSCITCVPLTPAAVLAEPPEEMQTLRCPMSRCRVTPPPGDTPTPQRPSHLLQVPTAPRASSPCAFSSCSSALCLQDDCVGD